MGVSHGGSGVAVSQQSLHLIEGVPGIDQKGGEGMPQVMDAHVRESQTAPQPVPEEIEIAEGLSRSMAGEQPRSPLPARDGANDRHGLVGQRDMARPAGLGQGAR